MPSTSESGMCYAISSGAYSDYSVSCVFEELEDALAYLRRLKPDVEIEEVRGNDGRIFEWKIVGGHYDDYRVELFQYWPKGKVPHADA